MTTKDAAAFGSRWESSHGASFSWLDLTVRDIVDAFRYLRRNRRFFASTVSILALGIGATTAVFSVAEAFLLRAPPYPESDRLVAIRSLRAPGDHPNTRIPPGVLAHWQRNATAFDGLAGYRWASVDLVDGDRSERLTGLVVTPEFFEVFGVPLIGRPFAAEDRGNEVTVERLVLGNGADRWVVGNEVWHRHFDAEEAVVGASVDLHVLNFARVGPTSYTVLGVATAPVAFPPLDIDFQLGASTVTETIDFWMPQFVSPIESGEPGPRPRWLDVVARLRPGVSLEQAQVELDTIARRQAERYPTAGWSRAVKAVPLQEHIAGESRRGILLLSLGTAMVLLIACSNVATLLLALGVARGREVTIRTALGAPTRRLVMQFLFEAIIISAGAGVLGVLLAAGALRLTRLRMTPSVPRFQEIAVNETVLVFALAVVVLTAVVTGLVPALRSARGGTAPSTSRGVTEGRRHSRLFGVLTASEVALTVVLLLGAGLLVRSAVKAHQVDTGFNPHGLLTMTVSLPTNKFDWDHNARFAREVLEEVRSLPSIRDAAVVHGLPMRGGAHVSDGRVAIEGYSQANAAERRPYHLRIVSLGYFATMQIPIVAGRAFEAADEEGRRRGFPRSILVSESFAERYWPDGEPLGKRIGRLGRPFGEDAMTVVGVVRDVRYSGLETGPTTDMYLPQGLFPQSAITLIARTAREGDDPLNDVPAVRERIRSVDPHAFVTEVRSMDQLIAGSQAERRAATLLVSVFGVIAMVLVVAGVYSVITQAVVRRRLEIAIRSALGAGPRRVVALAMRTALQPAAAGIAIGALVAIGLRRVMASLLFEIGAFDVVTWAGAGAALLAACLVAAYVPARQAARIDPIAWLRSE